MPVRNSNKTNASTQVPSTNGKHPDFKKLFEACGVEFNGTSGSEALAEACPWCNKNRFHVNVTSGLYHCKHCQQEGNVTQFLTMLHRKHFDATKAEHFSHLGKKRGIAPQTLRSHELAYDPEGDRWLIPFKNAKGSIVNIQFYYSDRPKPNKINLPGLPTCLYGFDKLTDKAKPVLLCEGPFDAIALDYSIGHTHRDRYTIVATPGALKESWAEYFRGYQVRAFYHNDKGGEQHREKVKKLLTGVASDLRLLKWPDGSPNDINDLIRLPEFKGKSVLKWLTDKCFKVAAEQKLAWCHGWEHKSEDSRIGRINKCRRMWPVSILLLGGEISMMGTDDQESKDGVSIHSSV